MIRRLLTSDAPIVALGLVVGATSLAFSWLPLVAIGAVLFVLYAVPRPAVAVAVIFTGILLAARGVLDQQILGIPITLSKLSVLFALGVHLLHVGLRRRPLVEALPVTPGVLAILGTMLLSLTVSVDPAKGFDEVVSIVLLTVLVHLVYTMTPREAVPSLLRYQAVGTVLVVAWTLATQREESFYYTLDDAWQQRTTGAYGDPNAWATSLLVSVPMLIGFLSRDRHWSARPLLVALGALMPLAILQSISRAGLLVFLVIAPGLLWLVRQHRVLVGLSVAAVLAVLPFVVNLDAALLRYQTLLDPTLEADLGHGSLQERSALLEAGIRIFRDHPWLGVGVGMFRYYAASVTAGGVWKVAHNSYLNVAAEQGIPGLLSHAWFGFLVLRSAWNCWRAPTDERDRAIGFGFLLSVVAYGLMAATLNLLSFTMAWYVLGLGLAIGRHGVERAREERPVASTVPVREALA